MSKIGQIFEKLYNIFENFITDNFTLVSFEIMSKILLILALILVFTLVYLVFTNDIITGKYKDIQKEAQDAFLETIHNDKTYSKFNVKSVEQMLLKYGAKFKYKKLDGVTFIILSLIVGFALGLILMLAVHPLALVPGVMLGYCLPEFIIKSQNSSDNDDMMDDIRAILTTLKMQTKAGLYITSALSEAYTVVKSPRLKQAILELSGDVMSSETLEDAISNFQDKFSNPHMDSLAIIIKQASESGSASESFKDVETNLEAIQTAIMEKEKKKMSNQVLTVQLLTYFGIAAIIIYAVVMSVLDGMDLF